MTDNIFTSLFANSTNGTVTTSTFFACLIAALVIGAVMALVYKYKSRCSQSFMITLAIIPAAVCMVIMLVNGDFGTGVAVAGAFGLIRFRSVPGTAREIGAIFTAMGAGLACGVGYIGYAAAFASIMCAVMLVYNMIGFGANRDDDKYKKLHVTIPENLDYSNIFDDLFDKYTDTHKLVTVKTTNMGSLFKLTYEIKLKSPELEKQFIDELRCRNGNLEINISQQETAVCEL